MATLDFPDTPFDGQLYPTTPINGVQYEYSSTEGTWLLVAQTVSGPATEGHVIKDEGSPLPQRENLNFFGEFVQSVDNVSLNETTVKIGESAGLIESTTIPGDLTASPNYIGGSGTQVSPYILRPLTVPVGELSYSIETISVLGKNSFFTKPKGTNI